MDKRNRSNLLMLDAIVVKLFQPVVAVTSFVRAGASVDFDLLHSLLVVECW